MMFFDYLHLEKQKKTKTCKEENLYKYYVRKSNFIKISIYLKSLFQ